MYRSYFINGFVFNDHGVLDHHIDSKARIYCYRFILDWERDFTRHCQSHLFQFVGQALLIHGFEKAGPQGLVYFNGGMYDISSDVFDVFHYVEPLKRKKAEPRRRKVREGRLFFPRSGRATWKGADP